MAKNGAEKTAEELEKSLTERQRRFVDEYLRNGGNGKEAAIIAGYSERSAASQASRMLNDAKVSAYRRARARQVYINLGLTPEKIGLDLYEVFQRCMAAVPHLSWNYATHEWEPDGTYVFDAKGATRALELLGRMEGVFKDKVEVTGGVEDYLRSLRESGKGQSF